MAEKLRNCQICGKLFMSRGEKICQNCQDALQDMEHVVVDYVRDHPKCKIAEIMENTNAPESLIRRLIEEGRFVQVGVQMSYPCKKCGKEIFAGQYCEDCLKEMQENLQAAHGELAKAAEANKVHGMYSKELQRKL